MAPTPLDVKMHSAMYEELRLSKLSTLWLFKFNLPEAALRPFWRLCDPWLKYLYIKPDDSVSNAVNLNGYTVGSLVPISMEHRTCIPPVTEAPTPWYKIMVRLTSPVKIRARINI
jgi:hypothetical protein